MTPRKRNMLNRVNDAIVKINAVSLSYQQGRIKYMAYAEQMDAAIDASGLSRDDFYAEISKRSEKLK